MFCAHRVRGIGLYIHRILPPEVVVFVAPQVDVPNTRWNNAGTSAGATGGIHKLLPPSVGETTGGIRPHAVRHKYLCPTGGK